MRRARRTPRADPGRTPGAGLGDHAREDGKANGCIAYLSYKRKAHVYQPKLVEEDGRLMLEVEAAKTVAGEPQRER